MLEKLQPAPMFRAMNQNNQLVSLHDFAGEKNIVLYFYPKDDTPGCTIEANEFTQLADEFANGACFVGLAPVSEPGGVVPAIARALGLTERIDVPTAVAARLKGRRSCLNSPPT